MIRGDTLAFAVKITFDSTAQELDSAYFTCKRNFNDAVPVFQKKLNNGIYLSEQDGNSLYYIVRVAPVDTKNIDAGEYYYDFQISVNGDVFTVLYGVLMVNYDVTTSEVSDDIYLQRKTVIPSTSQQIVTPDTGYIGLSEVTILAVPNGNNEAY